MIDPIIEDTFKGHSFHTSRWPHTQVNLTGQKIAVIGTGASGVQTIQEVCKDAGHLTVFQRRPNWCAPLHNSNIKPDEMKVIRSGYKEMFKLCEQTRAGFLHNVDPRGAFEVAEKERHAFWEHLYASKGFGIWQGNFKDVLTDPKANKAMSDFVADKIRGRVNDPEVAEKLIPKDHGFLSGLACYMAPRAPSVVPTRPDAGSCWVLEERVLRHSRARNALEAPPLKEMLEEAP